MSQTAACLPRPLRTLARKLVAAESPLGAAGVCKEWPKWRANISPEA